MTAAIAILTMSSPVLVVLGLLELAAWRDRRREAMVARQVQLTDAIASLNRSRAVFAYEFEGKRYDVGEKMGFIQTTIEFALQREDLRFELLDYLTRTLEREAEYHEA